jgi:excisionase family DNA binding protein
MENHLSFEKLPEAVVMLTKEVSELKKLLIENQENSIKEQPEKLLTIQEASVFLSLSIATIYSKVSKGELPVMKGGKRLYFSSVELLNFLKQGRKKSKSEIEQEAEVNLLNLKKGLNNGR